MLKKKAKISDISENLGYLSNVAEALEVEKSISFAKLVIKEEPKSDTTVSNTGLEAVPPSVQEIEVQTDPLCIVEEVEETRLDLLKPK